MALLEQMEIFYWVATSQSFTRAAKELKLSKGYISTQINKLEKNLGHQLLHRTTRQHRLTEEGELFLESCSRIVDEKKSALLQLDQLGHGTSGQLKISAPPSICTHILSEIIPLFHKQYPHIQLELDASASVKRLLQDGIDLALRMTHHPDENHIARAIGSVQFVICASKEYLEKHGRPQTPLELKTHNCLIYLLDPAQHHWPFQMTHHLDTVQVEGNLRSADSSIIKSSVLAGQGIARLPSYILWNEIKEKKIELLFSEQLNTAIPIYAIYTKHINIPNKIKYFINFLKRHFILNA